MKLVHYCGLKIYIYINISQSHERKGNRDLRVGESFP